MLKEKSQLLEGSPGLNMLTDALEFARSYLGRCNLDTHPDYLYVGVSNSKKSMGVDEAKLVENKASLRPSLAARQVIVIDGIDMMTVAGQNKLLKTLEDKEAIIIAISYGNKVLDTVYSRLEIVPYHTLCREDFCGVTQLTDKQADILFAASHGCPAVVERIVDYLPRFEDILSSIETGELSGLIPAMSLLKEKDKESIAESSDRIYFINFLLSAFMEQLVFLTTATLPEHPLAKGCPSYSYEQLFTIMQLLMKHQCICQQSTYSKNNFFHLIVGIIESM